MTEREPLSRRWTTIAAATLVVITLAVAACGPVASPAPSSSSSAVGSPTAGPSASTDEIPFTAASYPADAEAPCAQGTAPDATHGPYTGQIKRIKAAERLKVIFELCDPDVAFLAKIASPSFAIQDSAWLESKIDPQATRADIVSDVNGTGPFMLDAWNLGSDVMMRRNDNYWGDKAKAERLIFRWTKADGQRVAELQARTVDGADILEDANVATAVADADLTVLEREGMNTAYLGFNSQYAPFDDQKVRTAVSLAIDRAAIVKAAFPPGATVADHVSPCSIPFGCAGNAWPTYDPGLAKETLTAAGFADGFKTTIRYSDAEKDYLPNPTAVAQAIADQLKTNLGIDATLEVVPFDELVSDAGAGKLDGIHLLGFRPRYPDASAVLDPLFGASARPEFGPVNDAIATALTQGASTTDPAARTKAYGKANDAIRASVPMIPLAHTGTAAAYQADVTGASASAMRLERFASVMPADRSQFVWMRQDEPAGLYCADEVDAASLLTCAQMSESLYGYASDSADAVPALATSCAADTTLTVWTCTLREGVTFHDGSTLDAKDVLDSFAVQWDAANPRHRGRTGMFATFATMFGGFLNPPPD